ncbi:MAG: signal peptidase II [Lachnospiraceae bacterium]|nr:signal peptidase II [Lachnospiraceae bacterium]
MQEYSKKSLLIMDILLSAFLVALDQLTKMQAVRLLMGKPAIQLIPGVLEFCYLENTGAAFSILRNARWFFVIVAVVACIVIAALLLRIPRTVRMMPFHLCLVFILSGALGNLIDRLTLGIVRDFIYFSLINFPVFNVADIYVTCATFVLIILILFRYQEEDFHLGK